MARLRDRLLLGYAAVISILLVSGAVIAVRTHTAMQRTIAQDAENLATSLMDGVELALLQRIQTLRAFVGTNSELHAALEHSNEEFARLGDQDRDALIDERDVAWIAARPEGSTAVMDEILACDLSALLVEMMGFHHRVQGKQVFAELILTNRYGANVGQSGPTSDYRQNDELWWKEAWKNGTCIAEEVALDASSGVHSIDLAVRVDSCDGEPLGVLKAVLDVGVIQRMIDGFGERSRRPGTFVELLDAHGHLVHRQDDDPDDAGQAATDDAFGEDLAAEAAVQELLAGREGAVVESTARGEVLRAFVRARAPPEEPAAGWSLILNQRTEIAYAPLREMTRWTVGVGVVGAIAAALVGYLISLAFARMTRDLQRSGVALRASEARVRSIVSNVVDGIITADERGTIESVNPAVEQIFGRRASELLGRNVSMLMPEPQSGQHDGYLERYRRTGEAHIIGVRLEVRGLRADGTEFPLDLAVSETHEGERRRFIGIVRDASERHAAHRALEEAKEAAEAANRSKSQFLANMSHELRTPLNAVIGYAELVAEELDDPQQVADLGKIRTAGLDLLRLIDDILDLSKVEAGRMELHEETFDVLEALDGVAATIHPLVRRNGNTFELDAAPDLGTAHCDLTKLRQILLNLLSNASKFTDGGRIRLVARRESDAAGEWLDLRVSDDGIGMTPDQLSRVWEAFAQADGSTTRQYGGTGLGLTITRRFAELMGGQVDAASQPGAGTTFTVRVPIGVVPTVEGGATPRKAADPGGAILLVDDDPAARELLRRFLTAEGLQVIEAAGGEEGLEAARRWRPSVIVLDVLMPGKDGWDVLAGLRDDPDLADIPVVMLTMSRRRDLGLALGVDAYLTKPLDRARLLEVLATHRIDRSEHRILLVEDDEDARAVLARLLTREGWKIAEAGDGQAALEQLEKHGCDLVILDLMMPVMDGFQFVRALQSDSRWSEIPVIVTTAKEITQEDAERLSGGVEEIVRKGHQTTDELLATVARLVRQALVRAGQRVTT